MKDKKKCSKCKNLKSFNEFSKCKDGLRSDCKNCNNKASREYSKTKDGLITRIYGNQRDSSRKRKHSLPSYTNQELKNWLFDQNLFHELYDNWVKSDFDIRLTPSVDRKKDNLPYSLDNIQLMTWDENYIKSRKDMRDGKLIHGHNPQKPVIQFDLQGNFITEFVSLQQAERETKVSNGRISNVCNRKKNFKTAGGFKWEFKKNNNDDRKNIQ